MDNLLNIEAEQGALGLLLADNSQFDECALKPEHFGVEAHGRVFKAISEEIEAGRQATPSLLKSRFKGDVELLDGEYVVDLYTSAMTLNGIRDYEVEIIRHYLRRETMAVVKSIEHELTNSPANDHPTALLGRVENIVASFDKTETKAHTIKSSLNRAMDRIIDAKEGKQSVYKTGYANLDRYIGGLKSGGLYVIAGRPGMGKTVAGLNMAEHISHERPVMFFSLEMPTEELSMRMIAGRTGISVFAQMNGKLSDYDIERIQDAREKIGKLALIIDETAGVDIDYICTMSRRFARKYPNGVVIIDHLGLMRGNPKLQKVHQIEEITNRLKSLAKQIKAPVVLLSQLSRAVEMRDDKRPMLSDLRDSGSIEQDADVVMFAFRPEYYVMRDEPKRTAKDSDEKFAAAKEKHDAYLESIRGKAYLFIEKNRQGIGGTVNLKFDGERQRFFDV